MDKWQFERVKVNQLRTRTYLRYLTEFGVTDEVLRDVGLNQTQLQLIEAGRQ